uniref:Decapping nuclease n=1 Tax=Strongyloides papillosus TaxID=174720 RepID=A0A0N5CCJ1_STREA
MDCFGQFRDTISKPTKVEGYSIFDHGGILKKGVDNQVYVNSKIFNVKNIDIQLDRDINLYNHNLEESKVLLRSKMLLDLHKSGGNNLKRKLNGTDFFLSRETMCNIGNVYGCSKTTSWAFVLDDVIVIVKEYNKDKDIYKNIELNYFDHYFANIITSKDGLGKLSYNKRVSNLDHYYEVSTTDISMPKKGTFKVGHYCKVDAFEKETDLPVKIETQNVSQSSSRSLTLPKMASIFFKCLLGDIHTVVVGCKKDRSICEVKKYLLNNIMYCELSGDVIHCWQNIYKKFEEIKELFHKHGIKGCIKIQRDMGKNILSLEYFDEIQPEVRKLFTDEFCKTFF